MNEMHSGSWPGLLRTGPTPALPPSSIPLPLEASYGDSLIALGHLQVVEVGVVLRIGMEGKETTQEVVPSQVEVRVLYQLSWLSQSMQQEKQQVKCPCPGPHGSEVIALEDAPALLCS